MKIPGELINSPVSLASSTSLRTMSKIGQEKSTCVDTVQSRTHVAHLLTFPGDSLETWSHALRLLNHTLTCNQLLVTEQHRLLNQDVPLQIVQAPDASVSICFYVLCHALIG